MTDPILIIALISSVEEASDKAFASGMCLGCILGGIIFGILLGYLTDRSWRNEAVKQGKAEYYLDGNNQRKWRWL